MMAPAHAEDHLVSSAAGTNLITGNSYSRKGSPQAEHASLPNNIEEQLRSRATLNPKHNWQAKASSHGKDVRGDQGALVVDVPAEK